MLTVGRQGIGRAIASIFPEAGAKVLISDKTLFPSFTD